MLASILSVLVLAPLPAEGAANGAGLQTRWDTTPACVVTDALVPRVAALTGRAVDRAVQVSLAARRSGSDWRISMELHDAARTIVRTLHGRDCATLTEAVALIVAVQLEPMATTASVPLQRPLDRAPTRPPPTTPDAPPPDDARDVPTSPPDDPRPPPTAAIARTDRPPTRTRPAVRLSAAVAAELGILPRHGAAFELAAGPSWRHARIELGALTSVGPATSAAALPSVGGRFALWTGLLRGCGVLGRGALTLPLCGAVELGDLRARGEGLRRNDTIDALWVATTLSARPQWAPTRRLVLGGFVEGVAPLRWHRFSIAEAGLVHAVPAVAARLGITLALRLP